MKILHNVLLNMSVLALFPAVADAAGTYYNSSLYQNSRYGNNQGYYSKYGMARGYPTRNAQQNNQYSATQQRATKKSVAPVKQGFVLDAGFTHEMANWKFDMNNAGSKLHYDNVSWNTIGGEGTYYFGTSTPMQVKFGARYGKQFDETTMVDDDITDGGYIVNAWDDESGVIFGYQTGHALSVGKSSGGTQTGFNASFGLTDAFSIGRAKITPSVGYRYLKYKLSTERNYGVAIDIFESNSVVNCVEVQPGEVQCNPFLAFVDGSGTAISVAGFATDSNGNFYVDENGNFIVAIPSGAASVDVGGTYYYEQSGTSHEYKTMWAGPYLALDMEYAIDNNNVVNAGLEFGLPVYNSKGNQPYRYDWEHPTSVEDKGSLGDAIHLGLSADWSTKISDSMYFSLGLTYDYYKVSDATAKTYLNTAFYQELLDAYLDAYEAGMLTEEGIDYMENLEALKAKGWTQEDKSEINSVYKSMGIRAGISIKF